MRIRYDSLQRGGWIVIVVLLMTATAWSQQRIQFPTQVAPGNAVGASPPFSAAPSTPSAATAPLYNPPVRVPIQSPLGSTPQPALPPLTGVPPATGSPPAATLPSAATPVPTLPPSTTFPGSPPPATLQGTILPGGGCDPYANPNAAMGLTPLPPPQPPPNAPLVPGGPPGLFPQTGQPPYGGDTGQLYATPGGEGQEYQRFFREIAFEYTYLYGSGSRKFQVNTLEFRATTQYPFLYNAAPLLVTPGFAVNFLEGPVLVAGLPGATYDAYLDAAWQPAITPWLKADLGARVGVYTDFNHVTNESIRLMGRGLAIVTLVPERWQLAFGVVYLDRRKIKLLPAGGVIWIPNDLWRLDIIFPRPRAVRKLRTIGTTEWALFFSGEYGGGTWTAQRSVIGNDQFDYNDIRVSGGLEWEALSGMHGAFEVGYVFNREFIFKSGVNTGFNPEDTFMIRAGIAF